MAFCPNCGAPVEGRYCGKCGTAVNAAGATEEPAAFPSQTTPASAGMTDNVASALAYVLGFVTGILFLVLEPYSRNKNVRFHAFQSIFMSVGLFILNIVFSLVAPSLGILVSLGGFVLWLFMIWKTFQNQKVVLPVIGPLAQQQV